MTRIRNLLMQLREQLWLIPAIFSLTAMLIAFFMLTFGSLLSDGEPEVWWLYSGDPDSARTLLSSLLSGLMTMTSLVVSMTFVILTLAASQLGPRLISMFVGDRQIQAVLGMFIGTIVYLIAILRTVGDDFGRGGVPHAAVTLASILTLACLFALLFYIHKIARSIVADNVVEAVSQILRKDMKLILHGDDAAEAPLFDPTGMTFRSISLDRHGYIQVVNYDRLVDIARKNDAVLEVCVRAGHHVICNGAHVRITSAKSDDLDAAIRSAFVIGRVRTSAQDLEHGIRQLVEIALRALSPGINDPFTAVAVIDRLGAALEEVLLGRLQPKRLIDKDGHVRVVADRSDVTGIVDAVYDSIRQAGCDHPAILIRIADTLGALARLLAPGEAMRAVLGQLAKLEETTQLGRMTDTDRAAVLSRIVDARSVGSLAV